MEGLSNSQCLSPARKNGMKFNLRTNSFQNTSFCIRCNWEHNGSWLLNTESCTSRCFGFQYAAKGTWLSGKYIHPSWNVSSSSKVACISSLYWKLHFVHSIFQNQKTRFLHFVNLRSSHCWNNATDYWRKLYEYIFLQHCSPYHLVHLNLLVLTSNTPHDRLLTVYCTHLFILNGSWSSQYAYGCRSAPVPAFFVNGFRFLYSTIVRVDPSVDLWGSPFSATSMIKTAWNKIPPGLQVKDCKYGSSPVRLFERVGMRAQLAQ